MSADKLTPGIPVWYTLSPPPLHGPETGEGGTVVRVHELRGRVIVSVDFTRYGRCTVFAQNLTTTMPKPLE